MTDQPIQGLAGIIAGESAIATVGQEGVGLCYRGYGIEDLAKYSTYEEVAYLLIYGALPTKKQLMQYQQHLILNREIPQQLKNILQLLPEKTHPMDVLRTGVSALGCFESEKAPGNAIDIANRLIACMPTMLIYWYQHHHRETTNPNNHETTMAGYIYHLLHNKKPSEQHIRALDVSLVLYAEHEFNASTFAARVTASTLSDFYSAIVSAIGTLRGPLHGGANEAAMQLISSFKDPDHAERGIKKRIADKQLVMGFGHRVYKHGDPRTPIIKYWAKQLAASHRNAMLVDIAERIEKVMREEKNILPNLDFYSSLVYHFCEIPTVFFTPMFVMSRVAGWSAHIIEQRSNNKLIRPLSHYIGPSKRQYISIEER